MVSKDLHREYFNSKADGWDTSRDEENIKKLVSIFREFDLHPNGNVLDVGCGTGILIPILYGRKKKQQKLFELDFSETMLRQNKGKCGNNSLENLSHIQADAQQIPFRTESMQWIICFAVLPHLSDKKKGLQECSRVLVPQGNLVVLHLMGSKELNCFHSGVADPVASDRLPAAPELAEIIRQGGLKVLTALDREDLYLIHAVKS